MALDVIFEEPEQEIQAQEAQPPQPPKPIPNGSAAHAHGVSSGAPASPRATEPQSTQARLDTILKDPKHPYWDLYSGSEAHKRAVQDVQALHQALAGEQAQAQRAHLPADEQPTELLANPPTQWDAAEEAGVRAAAAELGVPAQMINDAVNVVASAGPSAVYETAEALEAAARTKYGNDYENKLYFAHLLVREVGPTLSDWLDASGLELTRFRGHCSPMGGGVHDAQEPTTVPVRVSAADHRAGAQGPYPGVAG